MRVAVVGSGPAGFYAGAALLSADPPAEVDMIERLPTPWGLVRLGVAPDHPKIKSVSRAFERIAERPGFRFLGNVQVGRDLHHVDLVRLYDAVVYSVVAQSDRTVGDLLPSKLYSSLAAGRPILFLGPSRSEIGELVNRESLGVVVELEEDVPEALQLIREYMTNKKLYAYTCERARRYYETHLGLDRSAARVAEILKKGCNEEDSSRHR